LRALDDLVKAGKVATSAAPTFPPAAGGGVGGIGAHGWHHSHLPGRVQSPVARLEQDRLPIMRQHGLGLLPYFPLASGLLSGKYRSARHCRPVPGWPAAAVTPIAFSARATGASSTRSPPWRRARRTLLELG